MRNFKLLFQTFCLTATVLLYIPTAAKAQDNDKEKAQVIKFFTEYLAGKDGNVKSEGYYCTASVHVLPKLDVIASYDYLNKNKTAADKQTNYVAGLQYWFYPKCRVQAQYTYCDRHKGESSNLIQAQIQVRF